MKRLLRWGGLAISISTYIALTIWANKSTGETVIARGDSATRAAMQPFWILIYIGVAMFVASFLVRKRGKDRSASVERERPAKNSEQQPTFPDGSEGPDSALSPEAFRRVAAHLREEVLAGNLRPRTRSDPADDSPD